MRGVESTYVGPWENVIRGLSDECLESGTAFVKVPRAQQFHESSAVDGLDGVVSGPKSDTKETQTRSEPGRSICRATSCPPRERQRQRQRQTTATTHQQQPTSTCPESSPTSLNRLRCCILHRSRAPLRSMTSQGASLRILVNPCRRETPAFP